MRFLKTDFGKVHAAAAVPALVNVLLALALRLGLIGGDAYLTAVTVHVVCGFLILPLFLLLPLAFRTRTKIYRAMRAKLLLNRRDLQSGNTLLVAAKVDTMLLALGFVCQTLTGAAYRLFQLYGVYGIHTAFLYVMPVLLALHPVLMLLAHARRPAGRK